MSDLVANVRASAKDVMFGSVYPCVFTFDVEVNEDTENQKQKIDVVCKSQPVCGEEVNAYNHDIDEHNKTLDENVTKLDKFSLDFSRLMQSVRGVIKLSVPPKSLKEAAARVLATDPYDYSADTEENKQIIPVHMRSYIGNLRSYHMEYVLPHKTT